VPSRSTNLEREEGARRVNEPHNHKQELEQELECARRQA
jgi:hypothetical protein